MKKLKFLSLMSAGVLLASLAACQDAGTSGSTSNQANTNESSQAAATSTPAAATSTAAPAATSTAAPAAATSTATPAAATSTSVTPVTATSSATAVPTATGTKIVAENPTIFLAGDSTVQTYNDNQYIGGWGQYLDLFLDENITVKNAARGGRSSRSFINEGRLYDTKETNFAYTFTENGGASIESQIKTGDYLFIQFGHNDDDTKAQSDTSYQYERFVPLGTPDSNGIFPTIAPTNKQSTKDSLPSDMTAKTKTEIAKYGDTYYAYESTGANGTYKGFLKEYIDLARSKDAIPVLVTPVSRVKWNGNEIVGAKGCHGENLEYVQAVRQLAEEQDCLLIDLFDYTKTLLETATPTYANFLMALKPNSLTGTWPADYDSTYNNVDLGYSGIEATHYNKYGAYITAGKVAEEILGNTSVHNNGKESFTFAASVNTTPSTYLAPSNLMNKATIQAVDATLKTVNVTDPNRTFPTADALEAKLALIPAVDNITADNYKEVEVTVNEAKILYAQLNVDDRKEEYKTKIDAAAEKVQAIYIELKPKATTSYELDCSTLSALSDIASPWTLVDKAGDPKFSINASYLKFGGNGSSSSAPYLEITFTGTGTVTFTISAASGNTAKACLLGVSDGTNEVKATITEGSAKLFTFEFEITKETTYRIYRASGSGTGVMVSDILFEYFEAK